MMSCEYDTTVQALFNWVNTFLVNLKEVDLCCSKHENPKSNLGRKCSSFVMCHKILFMSLNESDEASSWFRIFYDHVLNNFLLLKSFSQQCRRKVESFVV